MKEFIKITCLDSSDDAEMFKTVVNQGIDSHLEAFTQSKFSHIDTMVGPRLVCNFHVSELELLVRRLTELSDELYEENGTDDNDRVSSIDNWISDIKELPEYKENE